MQIGSLLKRLTPTGLRARLSLLTLLAMLPLVALLLVQAETSRRDIIQAAHQRAGVLAQLGAARETDVIQDVQDVFRVLGRVPEFVRLDDPSCSAVLAGVERDHPQILFLATTDLAGKIRCSSAPAAIGANIAEWSQFRAISEPKGEAFTLAPPKPIKGLSLPPSLAAMAPLTGPDGKPAGVFVAELDLSWFSKIAGQIAGNPENRALVIDSKSDMLLAASAPAAGESGDVENQHPALRAFRTHPEGGVVDGVGPDKTSCIYGYAPIGATSGRDPRPGAILAVGIAWDSVMADANRHLTIWICLALVAIAAAVGAAAWLAETSVLRPVRLITRVASRLSEGELGARADLAAVSVDELIVLGRTLNTMAASLEQLALTDGLTNIANRRRFDAALELEIARAMRTNEPLALLMIDSDHFKAYNDRYGHAAGDTCLRRIASALQAVPRRPADLVARYGGEEFVILLPNTDSSGAVELAGKVLAMIRALGIRHADAPGGRVSVSVGIAAGRLALPEEGRHLLEKADKALYAAKAGGRDQYSLGD
jgi:diguanylate cyclase (GGDEF)-like protein